MARIRTFKPEFWEDDVVGSVSRDARLLFLAVLSMADDEGLLRWTSVYVKSRAFMYDDDVTVGQVEGLMSELVDAGFIYPYMGGRAQQRLAFVINFRRHQTINRPQPSKLPPPSLQSPAVRQMYGRRDGWKCGICGRDISNEPGTHIESRVSVDHMTPVSAGGTDYPSNIRAAHLMCNRRRGAQPLQPDELTELGLEPGTESVPDETSPQVTTHSLNGSVHEPMTDSVPGSQREGKGKGREGRGNARGASASPPPPGRASPEPPRKCPRHTGDPNPPNCGACGDARREHDAWKRSISVAILPATPMCPDHPDQPTGSRECAICASQAVAAPDLRALAAAQRTDTERPLAS